MIKRIWKYSAALYMGCMIVFGASGCLQINYNYRALGYAINPAKTMHYSCSESDLLQNDFRSFMLAYVEEDESRRLSDVVLSCVRSQKGVDRKPNSPIFCVLLLKRSNDLIDTIAFGPDPSFFYYNGKSYSGNCELLHSVVVLFDEKLRLYYLKIGALPC